MIPSIPLPISRISPFIDKDDDFTQTNVICMKCRRTPLIKYIYKQFPEEDEIEINCKCNYHQIKPINEFLYHIKQNKSKEIQLPKVKYIYYCESCRIHIENISLINQHIKHNLILLDNNIDIQTIKDEYLEVKEHLSSYMINIKDKYKEEIAIDEGKCYKYSLNINTKLLDLIEYIILDYNQNYPNYYTQENLLHFTNFHIEQKNEEESITDYFRSYKIINKGKEVDINKKKKIKTIQLKLNKKDPHSLVYLYNNKLLFLFTDYIYIYDMLSTQIETKIKIYIPHISDEYGTYALVHYSYNDYNYRIFPFKNNLLGLVYNFYATIFDTVSLRMISDFRLSCAFEIYQILDLYKGKLACLSSDKKIRIYSINNTQEIIGEIESQNTQKGTLYQIPKEDATLIEFCNKPASFFVYDIEKLSLKEVITLKNLEYNSECKFYDDIAVIATQSQIHFVKIHTGKVTKIINNICYNNFFTPLRDESIIFRDETNHPSIPIICHYNIKHKRIDTTSFIIDYSNKFYYLNDNLFAYQTANGIEIWSY